MKNSIQKTIFIALLVALSACSSKLFKHSDAKQRAVSSAAFSKLNIVDDFLALNLMTTQVADDTEVTEVDQVNAVSGEEAQNNVEVGASATGTIDELALVGMASSEVVVPQSYVYVQIIAAVKAESVARALLFAQRFDLPTIKIEQQQFKKVLIGPLRDTTQAKQVLTQAQQGYADAFIIIASEPLIPN